MTRSGGRPWHPCPSPGWAGASVGVEDDVALAEEVTVAPLAQSAMTAWLPSSRCLLRKRRRKRGRRLSEARIFFFLF